MENIRNSVPGYVPCVEAGDAKFREANHIDMTDYVDISVEDVVYKSFPSTSTASASQQIIGKSEQHWKPNDYIELSVLACICNFVFGLAALSLSFRSQEQWSAGNPRCAKSYGVVSMLVSLIAILGTPVIIFVCLWFLMPQDNMNMQM